MALGVGDHDSSPIQQSLYQPKVGLLALMSLKYAVCMLLIAGAIMAAGCLNDEKAGGEAAGVPTENLPQGFSLIVVIDESTPGIDMEDEIADFRGDEEIGTVEATVGKYRWGEMGRDYDAIVKVIDCQSESMAEAAVANYMAQPDFENPPFAGVDRFSTAVVNGRQVTEIRDKVGKELKYIYIWNDGSRVVLVEGNGDRAESLQLASATGL